MTNIGSRTDLNRAGSTRSNMTFGLGHQPSYQSSMYPSQSPYYGHEGSEANLPHFGQQPYPAQFEVTYTLHNPGLQAGTLLHKLDDGLYTCYKYFVLIIAAFEALAALMSLVGWFDVSANEGIISRVFSTFLTAWNAFQLGLEYQAIKEKDVKLARRAVALMQWYMIVMALWMAANSNDDITALALPEIQVSASSYTLIIIVMIAVTEGFFYLFYLFGALKVRNILDQVDTLLGGGGTPYREMA